MATTVTEAAGSAPVSKKKTRLNPARRKSAKAKIEVPVEQIDSGPPKATVDGSKTKLLDTELKRKEPSKGVSLPYEAKQSSVQKPTNRPEGQKTVLAKSSVHSKPNAQPEGHTSTKTEPNGESKFSSLALATPAHVTGGLIGCAAGAAVLLGAGLWKDFAGVESAILAARTAKLCMDNLVEEIITSLKAGTYSAPEALDMLRRTSLAYASAIPGGAPFVERMFREIDMVRKQRWREVDKVVADAYVELSKAGKRGAEPAQMNTIVLKQFMKLSTFASNAVQDMLARNPKMRPYRDEAVKALRPPPEPKVSTVRLNMAIKHKRTAAI